ncbi:uncharacterized protein BJ212DRAFT_1301016 [Suillus subaureus]|uniref:Uncharacterized protein n=1 Tax=Suillus subaureus TaxID=48587 RepID=A0A9P7E7R3_9AGAM|nr:uncharacterized protein BJ212DRAFT_1301016 [Suillus subaureus]KAG1813636.1 hypothetical protein BJ212DRAFT_1301016 [Suillus subaureus]
MEKRMLEATILEMVKGIPNVVQLGDHWDVQLLSKFSSRQELLTTFCAFVVAHCMIIKIPNNFVIHNGIGYFINFDHASILVEGRSSTYSHGTGTMPYILIHILQAMLDSVLHGVNTNVTDQDAHLNHVNSIEGGQDINADMGLIEHWCG